MVIVYWVAFILFALTALPSALYFVAYLWTGEDNCRHRAKLFYRWALIAVLVGFNIALYRHVLRTLFALF